MQTCLKTQKSHRKDFHGDIWRHRDFTMKIFMETHLNILIKIFIKGIGDMEENYYFY
jgi:hypothetical protein